MRKKIDMQNHLGFLVPVLILVLASACSPRLSPFTQRLYDEARWSEAELKQIQFYLSDPVILRRSLSGGESTISEGKIKMVNGRRVEEVVIPENTPGVLVFLPKSDRFAVSFEEGDDLYLMFGPNPKIGDRYVLLAKEWDKRQGKVTYNGKHYDVDASSAFATLMVDLRKINRIEKESRRAQGRTIN